MKHSASRSLGSAAQDPAVTLLLLLPLALLHLSGWQEARSAAFGFVLRLLGTAGAPSSWLLVAVIAVAVLWAIGRIRLLRLPWHLGAVAALFEGVFWGLVLGPTLRFLTEMISIPSGPLLWPDGAAPAQDAWRARLALAAGAGLYEECLFRGILLGGSSWLLRGLFAGLGWRGLGPTLAFGLALIASSAAFAFAHAWGEQAALAPEVLGFRFLAGTLLGLLYASRGLAVVAYAHATYDALLLW